MKALQAASFRIFRLLLVITVIAGVFPAVVPARYASASGPEGSLIHGDVTDDGIVDGKDALKIMRIVEGYITATDNDTLRGDVSPMPGTGGRVMGDGQLTIDDAEKILRAAVGLVPLGEVTGDFSDSPPFITGISPVSGPVGTQVEVTGGNFVEGNPDENIIMFGDIAAPVLSANGTHLVTGVPEGAESGYLHVLTPGGSVGSPEEFTVTVPMAGQLELPAGLDPEQFDVITQYGQAPGGESGSFIVPGAGDGLTVVGAAPVSGDGENVFLNIFGPVSPPDGGGQPTGYREEGNETVNALSTAKTLLWFQPSFLSDDPSLKQGLWSLMDTLPEVTALATVIEQTYGSDPHPLDSPELEAALAAASEALFNALPEADKVTVPDGSGGGPLAEGDTRQPRIAPVDLNIIQTEAGEQEIKLDSLPGNPLDWYVWLHQLDPNDFPQGLNNLPNLSIQVFDRGEHSSYTSVGANFWSAKLALVSATASYLMGLAKPEMPLELSEDEDAIYVIRSYSGAIIDSSPGDVDSAMLDNLKSLDETRLGMNRHELRALATNLIMTVMDSVGLIVSVEGFQNELVKAGLIGFEQSFSQQFPYGTDGLTGSQIVERSWAVVNDTISMVAGAAVSYLEHASWKSKLLTVFKSAIKIINVFEKISVAGKIAERVAGLCGTSAGALVGAAASPTPLESAFVVKGDPFSPKITSFSPMSGVGGTEVTIEGERFAPATGDNAVYFGMDNRAEVTFASRTQLKVTVPPGMGGYQISVRTPAGSTTSENSFEIIRTPVIQEIKPVTGYGPSDNFSGEPYAGTRIDIEGQYFDPDGADTVTFGGTSANVTTHYSTLYRVNVPAGLSPGEVNVKIATPHGTESTTMPFTAIGPPVVSAITPAEAKGGETVLVRGANFITIDDGGGINEVQVHLTWGEESTTFLPELSGTKTFSFSVPVSIPEDTEVTVQVETPAGMSNAVTFQRIAGLTSGGTVIVTTDGDTVEFNGQVTLAEAIQFVSGEQDPTVWDDEDEIYNVHWQEKVKTWTDDNEQPHSAYYWEETGQVDHEYGSSHIGDEFIHHNRIKHYHADHEGEVSAPVPDYQENLDIRPGKELIVTSHYYQRRIGPENDYEYWWEKCETLISNPSATVGQEQRYYYRVDHYHEDNGGTVSDPQLLDQAPLTNFPLHRQAEEADYVSGTVGNATADSVYTANCTAAVPVILGESCSYDIFELGLFQSGIEISSGARGIRIRNTTVSNPGGAGITIKGNSNELRFLEVKNCGGTGIIIDGGNNNSINECKVFDNTGNGIEITGSATGNGIGNTCIAGNQLGVYIHGTGTEKNYIDADIGFRDDGQAGGNNGYGVKISDGASWNTVWSSVIGSQQDGVLVTGQWTEGNSITGNIGYADYFGVEQEYLGNQGNGIHIADAARNTEISAYIYASTGNGILVDTGCDGVTIDATIGGGEPESKNQQTGIMVAGPQLSDIRISGNVHTSHEGVRISGVTTPVIFEDIEIDGPVDTTGIRLDGGTRNVRIINGFEISNCETGLLISGADTKSNSTDYGDITNCSGAGVHITGGASFNVLDDVWIFAEDTNGLTGIMLDGGAHDNQFLSCKVRDQEYDEAIDTTWTNGIEIDNSDNNYFKLTESSRNQDYGLIITNGSSGNRFHCFKANQNGESGIVVYEQSDSNRLENVYAANNEASGITIDGADNITIGSDYLELSENKVAGIRLTGAASHITIEHGIIFGGAESGGFVNNGIVVEEGANDVTIGSLDGGVTIGDHGDNGILVSGQNTRDVTIIGNSVSGMIQRCGDPNPMLLPNENGIRVMDGAANVVIGGSTPGAANIIIHNKTAGIWASHAGTGVTITGNRIGVDAGMNPVPNKTGILLDTDIDGAKVSLNRIAGNTEEGLEIATGARNSMVLRNTITRNDGNGVMVFGGTSLRNTLWDNSITGNGGKGITLVDGGNTGIAPPVIDEVSLQGGRVLGYVDGGVPRGSRVDVYADSDDEGETYVGSNRLSSNRFYVRGNVPPGMRLHAIVTDPDGNTSEFGPYSPSLVAKVRPSGFAFTSDRDGNPEIYVLHPGEYSPRRQTNEPAPDYSPALSPTSDEILFVSERAGNPDIWVMNAGGAGQKAVTRDTAPDYDPTWSPDGDYIAYVSERDGNPEIYVDYAPGTGPVTETAYDDGDAESTNSRSSGFGYGVHFTGESGSLREIRFSLSSATEFRWAILNWTGSEPGSLITEGTSTPAGEGWHSIDVGDIEVPTDYVVAMYFISSYSPGMHTDQDPPINNRTWYFNKSSWSLLTYCNAMIRVVPTPPSPPPITVSEAVDRHPDWSPDGQKIAFTSDRSGNDDIWVMNADGTAPVQLTTDPAADRMPAWSQDGTKIAFVSERDGNTEIYLMDADGSNPVRLTDASSTDTDPAWSYEGNKLLFASDRDTGMELYAMNPDGTGITRLTTSFGDNIQPDAGGIVYSAQDGMAATGMGGSLLCARPADGYPGLPVIHRNSPLDGGADLLVTVESKTAAPGDTVTLLVSLDNAQDLGNLAFDIVYDKSLVELTSVTAGSLTQDSLYAVNPEVFPDRSGLVRFNWVKASGFSGNTDILELTFTVNDGAEGVVPVTLLNAGAADISLADVLAAGQDGQMTIVRSGDADRNGTVNVLDMTKVARIVLEMDAETPEADANLDGVVDVLDMTRIARIILELD